MFDAVNGIDRKYPPVHVSPGASASRRAAVGGAAEKALGDWSFRVLKTESGAWVGAGGGTITEGITDGGIGGGVVFDGSGVFHAFFGSPAGHFTIFDAPGAGTAPNQGTNAAAINSAGSISGDYVDPNGVPHGFVRSPDGTITSFDPSGSVFTAADTLGINTAGGPPGAHPPSDGGAARLSAHPPRHATHSK